MILQLELEENTMEVNDGFGPTFTANCKTTILNIISIPNNDHNGILLNPNAFIGFSFVNRTYKIGGKTNVSNWLLI